MEYACPRANGMALSSLYHVISWCDWPHWSVIGWPAITLAFCVEVTMMGKPARGKIQIVKWWETAPLNEWVPRSFKVSTSFLALGGGVGCVGARRGGGGMVERIKIIFTSRWLANVSPSGYSNNGLLKSPYRRHNHPWKRLTSPRVNCHIRRTRTIPFSTLGLYSYSIFYVWLQMCQQQRPLLWRGSPWHNISIRGREFHVVGDHCIAGRCHAPSNTNSGRGYMFNTDILGNIR